MECSYNGILLINKKKKQTINKHNTLNRSQELYTKWKMPISKVYIMYNSIYITFSKWQWWRTDQGLVLRGRCDYKGWYKGVSLWERNSSVTWLWQRLDKSIHLIKFHSTIEKKKKTKNTSTCKNCEIWENLLVSYCQHCTSVNLLVLIMLSLEEAEWRIQENSLEYFCNFSEHKIISR